MAGQQVVRCSVFAYAQYFGPDPAPGLWAPSPRSEREGTRRITEVRVV